MRDVQGGAGPDHGEHVRIVLPVRGDDRGVNLNFVEVVGGEERASWAVDHAGGERFFRTRSCLAFNEPAGKLAGRIRSLAILDLQWEEVAAGDYSASNDRG